MTLFNATVLGAWKRLEEQVGVLRLRLDHFDTGFVFRTRCEWRGGVGIPDWIRTGVASPRGRRLESATAGNIPRPAGPRRAGCIPSRAATSRWTGDAPGQYDLQPQTPLPQAPAKRPVPLAARHLTTPSVGRECGAVGVGGA